MPKKGHRKPAYGSAQLGVQHRLQRGQCRIIAGKWRGRKIYFDDAEGLRPTTDRIRETVFNWLQAYLSNSYCLDCFAGSGALGFEALSRGANKVVFIEQNQPTANKLKDNVRKLKTDDAVIVNDDTLHWLGLMSQEFEWSLELEKANKLARQEAAVSRKFSQRSFDLVFLDPPFHSGILGKTSALLDRSGCLTEDAIIYVEHSAEENIVLPESWRCLKQKRSGQVMYSLFEKQRGDEYLQS